jgi:phospholipid-binding lipoprotein MlaA
MNRNNLEPPIGRAALTPLCRALLSANKIAAAPLSDPPLRPRLLISLLGFGVALVAADVHAQTPDDPNEGLNRRLYDSTVHLSRLLRPVVGLYRLLTPGPIGIAIHNVLTTLGEPVDIANDILQARLKAGGRDTVRFVANATIGIGGMIDVASRHGLPHHENDFGVTLGVWGVRPGPYMFVPFLGPSTVRDSIGLGVDVLLNPLTYARFPGHLTLEYTTIVVGGIDRIQSSQGQLETLTADAADPYATLRSVYLQSREAEIRGESAAPELPPIDEPAPTVQPAQAPAALSDPIPPPEPNISPVQQAAVSDLDAPVATAFPGDRSAPRLLAAAD